MNKVELSSYHCSSSCGLKALELCVAPTQGVACVRGFCRTRKILAARELDLEGKNTEKGLLVRKRFLPSRLFVLNLQEGERLARSLRVKPAGVSSGVRVSLQSAAQLRFYEVDG